MMKHKSVRYVLATALLGTAAVLSGCSILPTSPPKTRYNLPAATLKPVATQKNTSIYVATPQANRIVNSTHILVQPTSEEIQVYQGNQWVDNAPTLIRERFVQALNDANLYQAVSANSALATPWALMGTLRHFQVKYQDNQPVVIIQYDAQLVDRDKATIVDNTRFVVNQPATDAQITAIVDAFGLAADQLSQELITWLSKHQ